jgi:hypothetical protein
MSFADEMRKNYGSFSADGVLSQMVKDINRMLLEAVSDVSHNQRIYDRVLFQAEVDSIISDIKAELRANGFSHYEVKLQSAGASQMIAGYRKRNMFDKKPSNITRYTWETDPQFKTMPVTEKVPAYALYVKVSW